MSYAFDRGLPMLTDEQQRIVDFLDGFTIETTPGRPRKSIPTGRFWRRGRR